MATLAEAHAVLDGTPLAVHAAFLSGRMRPLIDIVCTKPNRSRSRFGGHPDLPPGQPWPQHDRGPYRFIAQIDLAEVPCTGTGLPSAGLLSIFHAWDPEWSVFWQDEGFLLARYTPPGAAVRSIVPPAETLFGSSAGLTFRRTWDLPTRDQVDALPSGFDADALWNVRMALRMGHHQLLGHPLHGSLAYDPTPGPGWNTLVNFSSDDDLEWGWHDGDRVTAFIADDRLQAKDFNELRCDAG